jgi:hypothetical protein
MTGGPPHDDPNSRGPAHDGGAPPEHHDAWPAPFRTDQSTQEGILTDDDIQTPPEHATRPRLWPRVVGVLILLLGAGGAWVWQNPGMVERSLGSLFPGSAGQDTQPNPIKALEDRVARLEQLPDGANLAARLDTLEKRGSPAGQAVSPAPVDLRPLLARIDALEGRSRAPASAGTNGTAPGADLSPLLARIDALENAVANLRADPARVDALSGQVEALSIRDSAAEFRGKLDEITHQLGDLAALEAKAGANSDHALRIARLGAARIALDYGQKLGAMQDVPAALARFANTPPPTEASLRLDFTADSREALKVSQADTEGKPFLDSIMARLQDSRLLTVKEGDRVVIGNPAAATLVRAQVLLDAGDLDGAVAAVGTLTGPPMEKMAAWLARATSLQEARKALASLAGHD